MTREYKPRKVVPSTAVRLEILLRDLQNDIEACRVSETVKRQRRSVLRGFRAGLWAKVDRPNLEEIAQALRAELFGHKVELISRDKLCHSGTDDDEGGDDD